MKPTSNRSGGLSVLLNKPRARTEVAGDKSAALIRFYGCLRDWPEGLIDRLRSIAYTVESFAWACEASDDPDPIESAARFLVRNRFSRGTRQGFRVVRLTPGGQPGDANAWATILEELPAIAERLQGVELHQGIESLSTVFGKVPSGGGQMALGDSLPGTRSVRRPAGGRIAGSDRELPRAGNVDPVAFGPPPGGV